MGRLRKNLGVPSAAMWGGRILLALRAGPMDSSQALARWGSYRQDDFNTLLAAGLVACELIDDARHYRLTERGRAACPTRRTHPNPATDGRHDNAIGGA